MPFKKGNKLGARKYLKHPLDQEVIAFRGYKGQKEKRSKLFLDGKNGKGEFVEQLISELPKNE